MNTEFCDHCGDDFRYDDTGGYNPPCQCKLNCRSCCEHGACDRERDDEGCDLCGKPWASCNCDGVDEAIPSHPEASSARPSEPHE